MSLLINLENVTLSFGSDSLLERVNFQIFSGERVCLIGRNGAGKSSFLKIVEGVLDPDSGKVFKDSSIRIARLMQELPQAFEQTVYEAVSEGLAGAGKLLSEYHALLQNMQASDEEFNRLNDLQQAIDACDGWQFENDIQTVLTRLNLPADSRLSELSGGWLRRVALAKALVLKPDLLLLDEPTNHLDVEAIQWLEEQLLNFKGGILFITHDRALLQRLATRIIELDRGVLTSWPGDYVNFLRRKEELLSAEAKQNSDFDKKLAEEERWIRQGIKARRTRNEGRVRALEAMRNERRQRREVQGSASFEFNEAQRSGQLVVNLEHVTHQFGDKVVIKKFTKRILRGERLGLLGPNGAGKTTLLNILLGRLTPTQGTVQIGTQLKVAYFDQLRATLDPEKSILENIGEGQTTINVNGKDRHVISYLSDFLFPPFRIHTPVKALSGGECNRLLLAKLFTQPANLIVMDEPTNDLDMETLELLEELLSQFAGTILLVSHDREFLDNVVTSLLVFEGDGRLMESIGGYQDWLRTRVVAPPVVKKQVEKTVVKEKPVNENKLSYNEQKELAQLPKKIDLLEKQQVQMALLMANPDFYKKSADEVNKMLLEAKKIESELAQTFKRWEKLEEKRGV